MYKFYWFANTRVAELRELDFNTADWYVVLTVMDKWYKIFLTEKKESK